MTGFSQFLELFGDVTIAHMVVVIFAGIFLLVVGKKICTVVIERHEAAKAKDAKLDRALAGVEQYPTYRQKSIEVQEHLEHEIQELRNSQQELSRTQTEIIFRLKQMEERINLRDQNKLRDLLLQNYRYYTNSEKNPSGSWTRMEADAFWALFHDYEDAGGDGFMHTDVQPAMEKLTVVDVMINRG